MFNIYNYLILGGFGLFMLLDWLTPARSFYRPRWWRLRGVLFALLYLTLASYAPLLWDGWLGRFRPLDASALALPLQILLGYGVIQLISYWWHRAMHRFDLLWRVFHQMHHSAERIDVYGSMYFHPLDMLGFIVAGSLALTVVVGIGPEAAAVIGVGGALISIFTHANLKTPHWLGYLIARPEVHALHHQRGRHAGNYGELMVWDMLFGTFSNPRSWNSQAGFYDGASDRLGEMLLARDVSEPKPRMRLGPVLSQLGALALIGGSVAGSLTLAAAFYGAI